DSAWIQRIEATVPRGGSILELPYADDAESLVGIYEQVPYMLSPDLRWSVGAFRGMPHAYFEARIASLPAHSMITAAVRCGFDGVLVFQSGFADHGAAIEAGLSAATGQAPIRNRAETQAFFPIHGGQGACSRAADTGAEGLGV